MAQQKDIKTGKWMYYGSYIDVDGKRKQYKKRGYDTKKEARLAEDKFRNEIENQKIHINFDDLCNKFISFQAKRVKKATLETDIFLMNSIKKDLNINKYRDRATLQQYIDECDSKFTKEYVSKIYYFLNKLFNYAVSEDYLQDNPMRKVRMDSRKNERKKEKSFWEPSDFDKFIKEVDSPFYKCLFMTLYYMGIRKGELMALSWKDIDLNKKTIKIDKTYSTLTRTIGTPKTQNSYRTITMPDILVEEMAAWKTRIEAFVGYSPNGYVFGNDRPVAPETLRRKFHEYIKQANMKQRPDNQIPVIRIHDLRHSHASFLINNMSAGFTDFDIAKRLGDTVATLHNTYAHWFKAADKGIIDFMNSAK